MDLILFIGLQGSGKSSFYRQRFSETHVLVSKDLWPNARRREDRQRRYITEALATGRSVVVDNTNPSPEVRAPLIAIGRQHGAHIIGYYFESDIEDCLRRNERREGRARVPEVGIFATAKQLRRPSYAERFDTLYHVRLASDGGFTVREWKEREDGPGPTRDPDETG